MSLIKIFCSLSILFIFSLEVNAQIIQKSSKLNVDIQSDIRDDIYRDLDSLFSQVLRDSLTDQYIIQENHRLTKARLSSWDISSDHIFKVELINFYTIDKAKYSLDVAVYGRDDNNDITLTKIQNLICKPDNSTYQFSLPTSNHTKSWNTQVIGNIRYIYPNSIDEENAQDFDLKNKSIAVKLGTTPELFDFYICDNYQEILGLLGVKYDIQSNGNYADGYGVKENIIFSVQANEDFSHDLVHYYADKKYSWDEGKNWLAEEGLAYYWGNAYYVDADGDMINQDRMLKSLNEYMSMHPETSLLNIFTDDVKVFNSLSNKISVQSSISGLICEKIESVHGPEGIVKILNCGPLKKGYHNYFNILEVLLGINKNNFNERVKTMIIDYLNPQVK